MEASTPSQTSRFYSVYVGLIHFVVIDTQVYNNDFHHEQDEELWRKRQLQWLEDDLVAAAKNREQVPWILVGGHYPIYHGKGDGTSDAWMDAHNDGAEDGQLGDWYARGDMRDDLEPLLVKHGVDFFFAGHVHNYETSWPVINFTLVGEKTYVDPQSYVHVITGAGGATALDPTFDTPWLRNALKAWGYGRITAHNATHFTYEHILNNDSSIFDTFTVVKSSHDPFPPVPTPPPVPMPPPVPTPSPAPSPPVPSPPAPTPPAPTPTTSCPEAYPWAYRPHRNFDFCCASGDDNKGHVGINSLADRSARAETCKDNGFVKCPAAPCDDYLAAWSV